MSASMTMREVLEEKKRRLASDDAAKAAAAEERDSRHEKQQLAVAEKEQINTAFELCESGCKCGVMPCPCASWVRDAQHVRCPRSISARCVRASRRAPR